MMDVPLRRQVARLWERKSVQALLLTVVGPVAFYLMYRCVGAGLLLRVPGRDRGFEWLALPFVLLAMWMAAQSLAGVLLPDRPVTR
jgi:hypothetical protein